ncbi:MAG: methyltransferase domain-containing protein [Gemmatimonadales bacterium]
MPDTIPPPGGELLDDLAAPSELVRRSLLDIARSNRWLGGAAAAWHGVDRLLAGRRPASLTLLDIGTGVGDIPAAVGRRLERRGTRVTSIGLERHPVAARLAREGGLATILGDGLALPLPDRAVDLVLASQVAHHLPPEGVVALAREASRVARLGVVVADLRPSRFGRWGFSLVSRVLSFDRATRDDGQLSLRRGFRPRDLATLLDRAGVSATVTARSRARIVAYWSTDG